MSGLPRIRQVVILTEDAPRAERALEDELGLEPPFRDDFVAQFGVRNAMYVLGDAFIEVATPDTPESPAWRQLERYGAGGCMLLVQVADIERTRARAGELGIRRTWDHELPDVSTSHLHPADLGGVPISLDEARPAESWRWGGPDWSSRSIAGSFGDITIRADAPTETARRWADLLEIERDDASVQLADACVHFVSSAGLPRLVESVELRGVATELEVAGLEFRSTTPVSGGAA